MNREKLIIILNIGHEIVIAIGILIFVTLSVFLFIHWMPGSDADSWSINIGTTSQVSQSIFFKYIHWFIKAIRFDFGFSLSQPSEVITIIRHCFPVTILLLFGALAVSVFLSLLIGILGAIYESNIFVKSLNSLSSLFSSIPVYLLGMAAFVGVYTYLRSQQFNVDYSEIWRLERIQEQKFFISIFLYLIPPALLGIGNGNLIELCAGIKNSIQSILNTEYIKAVRARGASVTKHVAKNHLFDLVSLIDARITYLISGAVVIENVFNWHGLGMLGVTTAKNYDYPVIMALVLLFSYIVLFVRICKVLLFYLLDPRMRSDNKINV